MFNDFLRHELIEQLIKQFFSLILLSNSSNQIRLIKFKSNSLKESLRKFFSAISVFKSFF